MIIIYTTHVKYFEELPANFCKIKNNFKHGEFYSLYRILILFLQCLKKVQKG